MRVSVVFTPEAEAQLLSLYRFIAARAMPAVAQRYVSGIIGYCESLRKREPGRIHSPAKQVQATESNIAAPGARRSVAREKQSCP